MEKKKRDRQINKRFHSEDVDRWQAMANSTTGGNLTLFMEKAADNYCEKLLKTHPMPKNWKPKQHS